jgi:hypothetical protein
MAWRPDYTTLARVKDYAGIADTVDDVELAVWIAAASRAIEDRCRRQFGNTTSTTVRTYRRVPVYDRAKGMWVLEIDDLQNTTGLLVNGIAYNAANTYLLPDSAPGDGEPYRQLGTVYAPYGQAPGVPQTNTLSSANWGWASVPPGVEAAAWLQINRWAARRQSPWGLAGSPDQQTEVRMLSRLDPDVATTLAGLSRRRRVG